MQTAILVGIIIFLGIKAFSYWLNYGALVSYVVAKDYPLPDNFSPWCEWFLKKSLGLKADLPDRL